MLPELDARALFASSAVVFLGLVLSVLLAWRELRAMKGPERFAASYALFVLGLVLFSLDHLPLVLSKTAANVLVVLGAAFVLEGAKAIYGLPPGRRVTVWTGVVAVASFAWFTHVRESSEARTILSSAFLAALLGAASWTSWHERRRRTSGILDTVTALALSTCALLFWARAVAIGTGLVDGNMLDGSPWLALPPLVCTVCAVVWTTTLFANTSRRLTSVVRAQNELLAHLLDVARAIGSEPSLDATLERVLQAVSDLTGASGASLLMLDEAGRFLRGVYTHGDTTTVLSPVEAETILEKGLAAWVVRNRTLAVVPDVEADGRWLSLTSQQTHLRSALSAPIVSDTVLSGVLTLVHPEPGHFGDDQRILLESTTAQIALALRNAQMAEARRDVARARELLNRVLEISARRTDSNEIVEEAADALASGSTWPRVYLAIPGADGHFQLRGRTTGLSDARPRHDDGILGRVLETGSTQREDAPSGAAIEPGRWSRLAIPLRHLGRTLGVAAFESPRPRPFEEEDLQLAEALAEAVSLGLGKAALARAREELTRTMVHDLRGPVAGIMGALELLEEAPNLEADERRILALAGRNARRQVELIDGILELARLEDGALAVSRSRVRPASMVEAVLRLAGPSAEARKLRLVSEVPEDLPDVSVDPELTARVLENLVGNAVKFSAPGAGPVRVSARLDGSAVELRVRDSGPGIEEELRPRLFRKFAAGTLQARGTGLGLAFCRLAVEAQGGRIWLEDPGPGAVFAFSLPLADDSSSCPDSRGPC